MPDPQFYGYNCSAVFYNTPVIYAHQGLPFKYNANGSDPDGDSLSYKLVAPFVDCNLQMSVPSSYSFPSGLTMNPSNGEINWASPNAKCPSLCGTVNIAYEVKEWRKDAYGISHQVGSVIRDMQLIISCNNNHPPVIAPISEVCVWAGNTCKFTVNASDVDPGQWINIDPNGIPFTNLVTNPASFATTPTIGSAVGVFNWLTTCNDLKAFPYQVVVNATDSILFQGSCSDQILSTSYTVKIKVIPPPPLNLTVAQVSNHIKLTWQAPYSCAANSRFNYFTVWRKVGCDPTILDTCQQGMGGLGYTKIGTNITSYTFDDLTVKRGQTYSYRVEAEFSDISPAGYNYNPFSGHPSDAVCIALKQDIPVIVNASVVKTDAVLGKIFIRWSKPRAADLDTLLNPGPYVFKLFHGASASSINSLIATKNFASYYQINAAADTSYLDTLLNTETQPYLYQISFFTQNGATKIGDTDPASSVFVSTTSSDNSIQLDWIAQVPWVNDSFTVFKKNTTTLLFDSLTTLTGSTYTDTKLANGKSYCYQVRTRGHFSAPLLPKNTFNFSQEICAIPRDLIAPCAPTLSIVNPCTTDENSIYKELKNQLNWNNLNLSCANDVIGYRIYYAATEGTDLQLIDSVKPATNIQFIHSNNNSVAGCYAVTAIDSFYNESAKSSIICIDNCPLYVLPNTFTPNNDGSNDVYHPFLPYRFIDHVDMKIFNRWGNLVFQTSDPFIGWDGKDKINNKELNTGTYYYVCDVFEIRVSGITQTKKPLSGYIELIK
jgi:gliding motility-associated-like protein